MTIIFKRRGCDTIRIPDANGRDIQSYGEAAIRCATITKDLDRFEIHADEIKVGDFNETFSRSSHSFEI